METRIGRKRALTVPMNALPIERIVPPGPKLNQQSRQAWVEVGRESERRNGVRSLLAFRSVGIAVLLALAASWSSVTPFENVARFAVTFGAIALMFQLWRQKRDAWAAAFPALAVVHKPVAPLLIFSASLIWGGRELAVR